MTLGEMTQLVGGELHGDPAQQIHRLAGLELAQTGDLVFAFTKANVPVAEASGASAAVVPLGAECSIPSLRVADPRDAQVKLLRAFDPPLGPPTGIHPTAVIDPTAVVGADPSIGPYAVLEAGVVVGDRCRIGPHCVLCTEVQLGHDCTLWPHVTLYPRVVVGDRAIVDSGAVVGSEGYSYRFEDGRHLRVPQLGTVLLGDDVEVGANACIDRAAVGATQIGDGSKVDNLVMIAHNCKIGRHCILVSQVGVAGSCVLGDGVVMAGQVGVADHITIGDGSVVGAKSGIATNLPAGSRVLGIPALPGREFHRIVSAWRRLPNALRDLQQLKDRVLGDAGDAEG